MRQRQLGGLVKSSTGHPTQSHIFTCHTYTSEHTVCAMSSNPQALQYFSVVYAALLYNGVTSQVKTVHVLSSHSGQLSTVGVVETGWTAFTTFHSLATV